MVTVMTQYIFSLANYILYYAKTEIFLNDTYAFSFSRRASATVHRATELLDNIFLRTLRATRIMFKFISMIL